AGWSLSDHLNVDNLIKSMTQGSEERRMEEAGNQGEDGED
ncbi:hypothetical protein A2U01_0089909, partial [Trifolium medium]|nr:hypothetical protein [Trifolium medium]